MKKLIIASVCLFSLNAFCCKPGTKMQGEGFFISGITNKLSTMEQYKNYEILNIKKINFEHYVRVSNNQEQRCVELIMQSYGTGSCDDFTAEVIGEKELQFSNCL